MSKGLTRSLRRGPQDRQEVVRRAIPFNFQLTVADPGSANAFFTKLLAGLPTGKLLLLGARLKGGVVTGLDANTTATFNGNVSIGSTATADATLSGTDVDMIPTTALGAATTKVSPTQDLVSTQTEHAKFIDNSDGSRGINLNGYILDAGISAGALMQFQGVLEVAYIEF